MSKCEVHLFVQNHVRRIWKNCTSKCWHTYCVLLPSSMRWCTF